jgi:hypothetical protein
MAVALRSDTRIAMLAAFSPNCDGCRHVRVCLSAGSTVSMTM